MAVLLKTASVLVSFIQIMQIRVQDKGKRVWKSRYVGDVSSPQAHQARAPLAAPSRLVGPSELHHLQFQLYLVPFVRKKIKEKSSSRFTIRRRHHLLFFLSRADLESVLGSREGKSSSSSSPTILHRQFHDALHHS